MEIVLHLFSLSLTLNFMQTLIYAFVWRDQSHKIKGAITREVSPLHIGPVILKLSITQNAYFSVVYLNSLSLQRHFYSLELRARTSVQNYCLKYSTQLDDDGNFQKTFVFSQLTGEQFCFNNFYECKQAVLSFMTVLNVQKE